MARSFTILALIFLAFAARQACGGTSAQESPVGDWRGQSVCQVRPSACHDEESLYHVTAAASKPGTFEMQADKIVEGKPVTMGTSPCTYDTARHLLACPLPNGAVIQLEMRGNEMHGTMKLKDGALWRKIDLKKQS